MFTGVPEGSSPSVMAEKESESLNMDILFSPSQSYIPKRAGNQSSISKCELAATHLSHYGKHKRPHDPPLVALSLHLQKEPASKVFTKQASTQATQTHPEFINAHMPPSVWFLASKAAAASVLLSLLLGRMV